MNNFEYAQPRNLTELLELLSPPVARVELLGGGTDLVGLMRTMVVRPERVVNVCEVQEMQTVYGDAVTGEVAIGAAVRLDELLSHPLLQPLVAVQQAIRGTASIQFQAQSTLGGELCRRPQCWYFRNGHGLLANHGEMVLQGDNRYHAILGNEGPAKFVNASRLAPGLIALGARARIAGPATTDALEIPLEDFYRTPCREGQREMVLQPQQVLTHIVVPHDERVLSATYEVKHGVGPEPPLVAAAAALRVAGGIVEAAKIVLGHVAPVPWVSPAAAEIVIGQGINEQVCEAAGLAATAAATPLKDNAYKVQLAKVAVKRAILQAATLWRGTPV